jgi:hypothetical protein
LLSNIYLHYALDLWAHQWRQRHAAGDVILVRYADDSVMGFQYEGDAKRFLAAMRERLAKFKLELHPDKTRLIPIWSVRRATMSGAGSKKAGNLRLSRFHALLWSIWRQVFDRQTDNQETDACIAGSHSGNVDATPT